MERMILKTLAFGVSSPTVNWFCLYLLKEVEAAEKASFLALVCSFVAAVFQIFGTMHITLQGEVMLSRCLKLYIIIINVQLAATSKSSLR